MKKGDQNKILGGIVLVPSDALYSVSIDELV